jgi:hypothetical protein
VPVNELIARRFSELEEQMKKSGYDQWRGWASSAMNLIENAFARGSSYVRNFRKAYENCLGRDHEVEALIAIFKAAKADYEGGYIFNLEQSVSGDILGDFVKLAKASLQDGYKDVAAVLACAALEDALKRYARENGLVVDNKVMQEVVGALKSKGLVKGAQKTLLDTMPKIRDYAMHANWDKIIEADVGSVIGYVEQFLLSHFS